MVITWSCLWCKGFTNYSHLQNTWNPHHMTKKVQLSSPGSVSLITQWQIDQYPQTNHHSTHKIRPNNHRQKMLHILSWYIPVSHSLPLSCSSIIPLAFWWLWYKAKPGICHLEWVHGFNKSLQRWMCMVVCIGEIIIGYVLYHYASGPLLQYQTTSILSKHT